MLLQGTGDTAAVALRRIALIAQQAYWFFAFDHLDQIVHRGLGVRRFQMLFVDAPEAVFHRLKVDREASPVRAPAL